jgi:hypothetical protein
LVLRFDKRVVSLASLVLTAAEEHGFVKFGVTSLAVDFDSVAALEGLGCLDE